MQVAGGIAGAVVGSFFNMPGLGYTIGSTLFGLLDKPDQKSSPSATMDLRVPGTQDGRPLPWIRGRARVAPDWAWHTDRRAITTGGGGGGGGGKGGTPEPATPETTTYEMDALFVLNINGGVGVSEIYRSGELIWRTDSGASAGTIVASNASEHWDRLTVYIGAADQLPDPDYESWVDANVGVGQAPAYRGRMTVFVKNLKLGQSGQIPQLEFTVVVDGDSGPQLTYFDEGLSSTSSEECASAYLAPHGKIWTIDAEDTLPRRIAIFNLETEETTFISFPDEYPDIIGSSEVKRIVYVEEYDRVLVGAQSGTAPFPRTYNVYDASSETYIGSWHDETGSVTSSQPLAVDETNQRAFITDEATALQIWGLDDDLLPTVLIESVTLHENATVVDNNGNFWMLHNGASANPHTWIKVEPSGAYTVIPLGSDFGQYNNPDLICHDPIRNCNFFWSDPSAGNYLKKVDCDTHAISRVNSVAYSGASNPFGARIEYEPISDRLYAVKGGGGGPFAVFVLDPDDGSIEQSFDIPDTGGFHFAGQFTFTFEIVWGHAFAWEGGSESGIVELRFNVLTPECPTVPAVQESICIRGGLTAGQVNVTPLNALTREVCCLPWSQISAPRVPSETMMGAYFYEATMSAGKVKFVPRGEAVAATVPYEDLGAHMGAEADSEDPLPLRMVNDLETPAFNIVNYINLSQNFQQGSENTDRLISTSAVTLHPLELALGMHPAEAKGVIDTVHRDRASALLQARIKLLRSDYPTLEPTDCVTVTGPDGSEYRVRIVQMSDRFPLIECDVVLDDPNVLSAQGITTTDYESQTTVSMPASTIFRIIDPPILQDSDDGPGVYALAKSEHARWPGANILDSENDVDFTLRATIEELAVFGSTVTALGDWTGPRVFDFKSTVRVSLGEGELTSSTRALVLSNRETNVIRFGNGEICQFVNADPVGDGEYDLSLLLRGCCGTEWAMTGHTAGETVELLTRAGMRRVTLTAPQLGVDRYYKAPTIGRAAGTATSRTFNAMAGGMKPYAPVRLRVSRDASDNATIECERRSRYVCRLVGDLGVSIPLSDLDTYEWDIYSDDTYTTVVDTLSSVGPSVVYTAAAQTGAGLTPGDDLHVEAFQMSNVVGRGYPLRRSA